MTQIYSKWYDKLWPFWEKCFKLHYTNYNSYEESTLEDDFFGGIDVKIKLDNGDEVNVQLKANRSPKIKDLPVHFAYKNSGGGSSAFDLYFNKDRENITITFFFGYPYADVFLVVAYDEMKRIWAKHNKEWKRTKSKSGEGQNKYIEVSLGEFMRVMNPKRYKLYEL